MRLDLQQIQGGSRFLIARDLLWNAGAIERAIKFLGR